MSFKTELHCHCDIVSACGRISPERLVERYLEAGYTSLVITDHISRDTFQYGNYSGDPDNWDAKVDFYMRSYRDLQRAAKGRLHIMQGFEIRLDRHHATDYLVYGLSHPRGPSALSREHPLRGGAQCRRSVCAGAPLP